MARKIWSAAKPEPKPWQARLINTIGYALGKVRLGRIW
jgi:hypothetical protein